MSPSIPPRGAAPLVAAAEGFIRARRLPRFMDSIADEIDHIRTAIETMKGTILPVHDSPDADDAVELDMDVDAFVDAGFTLGGGVFYLHIQEDLGDEDDDDHDDDSDEPGEPVAVTVSFLREGRFHVYYRADEIWEARMIAEFEKHKHDSHGHDEEEVDLEDADPEDVADEILSFAEDNDFDLKRDVNRVITEYWEDVEINTDDLNEGERRVVMKANALVRMAAKKSE